MKAPLAVVLIYHMTGSLGTLNMKVANATFIKQCVTLKGHARFHQTLPEAKLSYTLPQKK